MSIFCYKGTVTWVIIFLWIFQWWLCYGVQTITSQHCGFRNNLRHSLFLMNLLLHHRAAWLGHSAWLSGFINCLVYLLHCLLCGESKQIPNSCYLLFFFLSYFEKVHFFKCISLHLMKKVVVYFLFNLL